MNNLDRIAMFQRCFKLSTKFIAQIEKAKTRYLKILSIYYTELIGTKFGIHIESPRDLGGIYSNVFQPLYRLFTFGSQTSNICLVM